MNVDECAKVICNLTRQTWASVDMLESRIVSLLQSLVASAEAAATERCVELCDTLADRFRGNIDAQEAAVVCRDKIRRTAPGAVPQSAIGAAPEATNAATDATLHDAYSEYDETLRKLASGAE